jgi:beta-lactamase regulating signal transducer with metallopeptidase domain
MIAAWMLAAMALAAALGGAALALDRALRTMGRQGRLPWIFAVVAAVAWPVVAPLMAPPAVQTATVRTLSVGAEMVRAVADVPNDWSTRFTHWIAALDGPLMVLWLLGSALLLARLAWAVAALHRMARRSPVANVEQARVRITREVGPAVFALWRSEMLLPHWLVELEPRLRRLVVLHEREHMRALDAQLIVASFVLVALMPWNAPLWWLARRLRTAVELDCDARVLRGGADAHTYGQLLLLIAQRQGNARFLPMMAGAPSTLRDRIIAMSTPRPRRPALYAVLLTLAAAAFTAASASPLLARPLANARIGASVAALFPAASPAPWLSVAAQTVAQQPPAQQPPAQQPAVAKRPVVVDSVKRVPKVMPAGPADAKSDSTTKAQAKSRLDDQVRWTPNQPAPRYPEILLEAGITGSTLAMFVVDTTGAVDISTLKIVRTAHPLFVEAVQKTLPQLRLHPAHVGGRPVRQLVQVLYRFATFSRPEYDSLRTVKDVTAFEIVITGNDRRVANPNALGYEMTVTNGKVTREPIFFVDGVRTPGDEVRKIARDRMASVEVLKGDAARAKYGEEGKNGVVIITLRP